MDTELTEHEQQVLEANLKNPEALRIWGISSAKTGETVSFVLLVISIAATFVGTCCYFAFGNPAAIYLGTSGFCIVLALAIATVILRIFQRRLQHQDAARIGHELEARLTGITQQDLAIQADVEEKMEWSARKLNIAGFMILLALGVIAYLNIMQGGGTDMERNMIYSGCIAVFAFGYIWHMTGFNAEILMTELRCRLVASIVYQRTNTDAEAAADLLLPDEDELH